jgi:hypothetical protein
LLDQATIEKGGLFVWATLASGACGLLWRKVEALLAEQRADRSSCQACAKAHSEQLVTLGNSVVKALEQSTDSMATSQRQAEILKRLEAHRDRKAKPE